MKSISVLFALSLVLSLGCSSSNEKSGSSNMTQQKAVEVTERLIETIVVDVCKDDPGNAQMWQATGINLFTDPTLSTKRKLGNIPACNSITVEVLDKKTVDGVVFYKIRYKDQIGWQTKRLLTDAGNPNTN